MSRHDPSHHPDDYFARTRMPLGEHLEELRRRLWRALGGFALIVLLGFLLDFVGYVTATPVGVGKPVMDLIARPVEEELQKFYDRRLERLLKDIHSGKNAMPYGGETFDVVIELDIGPLARALAPRLGLDKPTSILPDDGTAVRQPARMSRESWLLVLEQGQRLLGRRPSLATFGITEAMMVYFKVGLLCGVVLGSPWIFWQLWSFVAAGLYPRERRLVHGCLPISLGLFLAGVLVCQFLVLPRAVETLLGFNEWLGLEPDLRLSEWLGFAVVMPLIFGVSFQTPLVMLVLQRLGILTAESYRGKRRLAWFLLALFAAVITPSPDAQSMLLLWLPMGLLYELGIGLCTLWPGRPAEEWFERDESAELFQS
jgi:sec-independent protein translocase protein TatC